MNKKILSLAIAAVMSVSMLAGCGSNAGTNNANTAKDDNSLNKVQEQG